MQTRTDSKEALRLHAVQLADANVVRGYVEDLSGFLESPGIVERKAFVKSLVEGIEVERWQLTVNYAIPVWPEPTSASEAVGVLPFIHDGPPSWT